MSDSQSVWLWGEKVGSIHNVEVHLMVCRIVRVQWMTISWMVSIDTVIIVENLSSFYKHYMYIRHIWCYGTITSCWGALDGMSDSQSVVACMAPIWMTISWMVSIDTVIIVENLSSFYKHYMYIRHIWCYGTITSCWGALDGMSDSQSVVACMAPIWMTISWMVSIDTVFIVYHSHVGVMVPLHNAEVHLMVCRTVRL